MPFSIGKKRASARKKEKKIEAYPLLPQAEQGPAPQKRLSLRAIWGVLVSAVRIILIAGMALLCAGVFFVAVIMGEAPELGHDEKEQKAILEAPLPLPGAGEFASREAAALAEYYPAPLAQLAAGSGIALQQGTVQDVSVDGITCRVVSLQYLLGQDTITLRSATPGGFLCRYATQDAVLSPSGVSMGALSGISMHTGNRQVILARDGELLYALEAPAGFALAVLFAFNHTRIAG